MKNLTKKSKMIIVVSACVSILLIITVVALLIATYHNGNLNSSSIFLILSIIVLAIVSLAIVIIVRLKRSKYTKQFNKEYYEVFETVQDAMKNSNLTKMETSEVMNDITSMLFHAQMEGRIVSDVVGDDVDIFVQKVKDSFGNRNSILFSIMNGVLYLVYVLALMQSVIFLVRSNTSSFFNIEMSISIVPYMVILSFFIIPFMRYYISKQKVGWAILIPIGLVVIYFGTHELFHYLDLNVEWIYNYLNGDFVFISSYLMLFIYLGLVVICLLLKWYLRYRSIKNL